MNIIDNYNQIKIGALQSTRLYLQGRPLLSLWSRKRRGIPVDHSKVIELIESELTSDFIAIDCAGWYFATDEKKCIAIELIPQSSQYWDHVHFEYDYLTWHPTYLPNIPVLAYFSTYFKYCELSDFLTFCKIWTKEHSKIVIGVDPTKIKFNYLKWDLLDILADQLPDFEIQLLDKQDFSLLFTLRQK